MALTNAQRQAKHRAKQQTMIGHTQCAITALNDAFKAGYLSSAEWNLGRDALNTVLAIAAKASRAQARSAKD